MEFLTGQVAQGCKLVAHYTRKWVAHYGCKCLVHYRCKLLVHYTLPNDTRYPYQDYLLYKRDEKTLPQEGENKMFFKEKEFEKWRNFEDVEAIFLRDWVDVHLPVKSIDEEKGIVTFKKYSRRALFDGDRPGRYYIENAFEFLKYPGQWYLDRKNGVFYYLPAIREKNGKCEIIYPVLSEILRLEGNPEEDKFVKYINFRNLTFSHTNWELSENDAGDYQAANTVPGAIYAEGTQHCIFEGCSFSHLGNYGIELARGCKDNLISNCNILDLGAGGIRIGEFIGKEDVKKLQKKPLAHTTSNRVINCHIYNGGNIFHQACGILVGQSSGNLISRNHIHGFFYTGISIGWTCGYGLSLARDNIVEYNHIHHIGLKLNGEGPILSDMGGVYTLGIQPGTIIRHNLFHDLAGYRYGGWGIYFDEGSTHIVAENNLVYNTTHGGFHQHYGKENIVRNNIFAYGRYCQLKISRPENHLRLIFERNIVIGRTGRFLDGNIDFNFKFNKNLYWKDEQGEIKFGDYSWEEWRNKGMDKNSLILDPLFINPKKYNFNLEKNSPAFKLGFKPIILARNEH